MGLKLDFKIRTDERLYISKDHVSNGHWLVPRASFKLLSKDLFRSFKPIVNLAEGCYAFGYKQESNGGPPKDLSRFIPKQDGYVKANVTSDARVDYLKTSSSVNAVKLKAENGLFVWVAPEYLPLVLAGTEILVKDAVSPVIVKSQDEMLAIVMPVRA